MCGDCHIALSDENVVSQLRDIKRPYNNWNITSINHLLLANLGVNGPEAEHLSDFLLNDYIIWKDENTKCDDDTFFGEPSSDIVKTLMLECNSKKREFKNKGLTQDQIRKEVFTKLK